MKSALIAFGANLANPRHMLLDVVGALGGEGVVIDALSPLYRSPAWPAGSGAPDYRNAVIRARSDRAPTALMRLLLDIETRLGRVRSTPNAPRTVDLDLLVYGEHTLRTTRLSLPHPRMTERAFVLLPLRDVAPDYVHPDGRTLGALIAAVDTSATLREVG